MSNCTSIFTTNIYERINFWNKTDCFLVISSNFLNCQVNDQNGGAISFEYISYTTLLFFQCLFLKCSAQKLGKSVELSYGGAIYLKLINQFSQINISFCCASYCLSNRGHFLAVIHLFHPYRYSYFDSLSILSTNTDKNEDFISNIFLKKFKIDNKLNNNSKSKSFSYVFVYLSFNSISIYLFSTFSNSICNLGCFLIENSIFKSDYTNFINNSNSLFDFNNSTSFYSYCIFQESNFLFNIINSNLLIVSCIFDELFFTNSNEISMLNCSFQKITSPYIYTNIMEQNCLNSTEYCYDFSGMATYSLKMNNKHSCSNIINSLFKFLTSISDGGAIYISKNDFFLNLESTIFFNCITNNMGGSIYFQSEYGNFICNRSCFEKGNAYLGLYLYIQSGFSYIDYSSMVNTEFKTSSSVVFDSADLYYDSINFTQIKINDFCFGLYLELKKFIVEFSIFQTSSSLSSCFFLNSQLKSEYFFFRNNNFLNNTLFSTQQSSLISNTIYNLYFYSCSFFQNFVTFLIIDDESSFIFLLNCFFDIEKFQVYQTQNNNSTLTKNVPLYNLNYSLTCHYITSFLTPTKDLNYSLIKWVLYLVIFLIFISLIALIFIRKNFLGQT